MNDPLKFKKGSMWYLLDMREAMGEVGEISRYWCRAFDAGDNQAMADMSDEFARAMKEFAAAAAMATEINDRETGG